MLRRILAPLAVLVLVFGAVAPSSARAMQPLPTDPSAFVQELSRYAIEDILKADVEPSERIKRFEILLDTAFDMPFIARFVVGGYWKQATEDERTKFLSLFRDLNVINWGSRFGDYGGQKIVVVNSVSRDSRGGTIHEVTTAIGKANDKPMQVIWVLRAAPSGQLGVIDLKVEGVSMALTFQSEYRSVLKNSGSMTGLNAVLEKKIAELRARAG
ncbi:toluene tolerance protein [Rhodospirillum rubrum]|uniref:MlaC/ttg2D family ABC transporter substrate-binding protein n=1 Tax=Rhodospirillum rubrum TaxID=1085 RepID=UPI0019078549|nr:ABC transporter substrate-binding protein [Rhodospirillum rubrum]MBK1663145.1 toluene tolerance protein [Rhodospirillum rubrum]MBK1675162.1 toluene tolerance protein [Rhodospirillum rubrum]